MKIIALENNIQRILLVAAIILIVIGIVLHNPLSGYDIPLAEYVVTPCSDRERAAYKKQLEELKSSGIRFADDDPAKDDQYIQQMIRECVNLPSESYGPLKEWRSSSPSVEWFGSILNLFTYLIAVSVAGVSGIIIFREKKN
jgi:hypothetical protein